MFYDTRPKPRDIAPEEKGPAKQVNDYLAFFAQQLVAAAKESNYHPELRKGFLIAVGAGALLMTIRKDGQAAYIDVAQRTIESLHGLAVVESCDEEMAYWENYEWVQAIKATIQSTRISTGYQPLGDPLTDYVGLLDALGNTKIVLADT